MLARRWFHSGVGPLATIFGGYVSCGVSFGSWALGRDLRRLHVVWGFVRELGPWPQSSAATHRAGFRSGVGPLAAIFGGYASCGVLFGS
ncbi:hypothetical protein BS47DRAFT_1400107 [Hydnum rufescens UP504]|uniref:Uncharacterized protein n=1 Tax=Hydnum rufescens UP504 TaxID=1448309 RepID=A0A9P6AHN3_9AGAM|nr:hypothetical protein BS47DRAFT_1400107 [Hydnum rufescens UP504]